MKRVLFVMLLLCCLALLSACSDGGSSSSSQAARTWYWDHELSGANAQVATENHTVVMHLVPEASASKAAGETTAVRVVPYTYKNAGRYEYCIGADDPFFVGMTITSESTGKTVATVRQGACVQADISPGRHSIAVTHNRLTAGQQKRLAFIGVPRVVKLLSQESAAVKQSATAVKGAATGSTIDVTMIGKLALADPSGKLLVLASATASDGKPNYFVTSTAKNMVDINNDLFYFAAGADTTASEHFLYSARGQLGVYYPIPTMTPGVDTSFGDCAISVTQGETTQALAVQSPLYTYSAGIKGVPPAQMFTVSDLGNYQINLRVDMIQMAAIGMSANSIACAVNQPDKDKYKNNLTVLFRYYEDGSKMPPLQQQGEVALFEKPNFTGKAFVYMNDQPSFRIYGNFAPKSVKVGPNTRVGLYSGVDYSALGFSTSTDVSDLSPTNVGNINSLGSLKVSPDIYQIYLSSNSCVSCDLSGLSVDTQKLNGYDFTNANLTGATFDDCSFDNVKFAGATIANATFHFIDDVPDFLSQMAFNACDFTRATLDGSKFNNEIVYYHSTYPYIAFNNSKMDYASIKNAYFSGVSFNNSTMFGTDMSGSTFYATKLSCGNDMSACLSSGTDSSGRSLVLNAQNTTINGGYYYSMSSLYAPGAFVLDLLNPKTGGNGQNCHYFDLTGSTIKDSLQLSDWYNNTADVSNCSFKNINFTVEAHLWVKQPCADMTNHTGCVDFTGSTFAFARGSTSTNLQGAIFDNVKFYWIDFSDALLNFASFKNAQVFPIQNTEYRINFTRAAMNNANLSGSNFNYANFQGANLSNANLSNVSFYGALFSTDTSALQKQTVLDGAYLLNTNMASADLTNASMRNTTFHTKYPLSTGSCLPDSNNKTTNCASAYKATLVGTNLSNAYLAGLDLSYATLYGANFANSTLVGANFTGAVVKASQGAQPNTSFQGAVLYGANFTNVSLLNTNLGGAYFDDPASPHGSDPNGPVLVSYLNTNYTAFTGSSYLGKAVCVRYQPSSVTKQSAFPGTDASSTCPNQSTGPCSGSQWQVTTPLDTFLYRLTYNYNGSPDPPPAPSQCSSVVFW